MDGYLYEKLNNIEQMLAYLVEKLTEAEKKAKGVKEPKKK
jgi:hypothetical protein